MATAATAARPPERASPDVATEITATSTIARRGESNNNARTNVGSV
jgi:hypothetical protein